MASVTISVRGFADVGVVVVSLRTASRLPAPAGERGPRPVLVVSVKERSQLRQFPRVELVSLRNPTSAPGHPWPLRYGPPAPGIHATPPLASSATNDREYPHSRVPAVCFAPVGRGGTRGGEGGEPDAATPCVRFVCGCGSPPAVRFYQSLPRQQSPRCLAPACGLRPVRRTLRRQDGRSVAGCPGELHCAVVGGPNECPSSDQSSSGPMRRTTDAAGPRKARPNPRCRKKSQGFRPHFCETTCKMGTSHVVVTWLITSCFNEVQS